MTALPGQLALLSSVGPAPLPAAIDLRNCDVLDMLASLPDACADLLVADPPWGAYRQNPGDADPASVYPVQSHVEIGAVLSASMRVLRPGGRLAMWATWPLLVEAFRPCSILPGTMQGQPWLSIDGLRWVSGGGWTKSGGGSGVGYHWRGRSEPVLLGVRDGAPAGRPLTTISSGHASKPGAHSLKPWQWQQQWLEGFVEPGGLVVDLYAGLGSVAVAAVAAGGGRRYVGAELHEQRWRRARMRVLEASAGGAL